ncbi:hypothetical protein Rhopal_007005-T1 [Rhodotorula paludigena]|uniref:Mitochondrial import inner membrane translocase subunit n=1 Tax=Rhodotorula paludigena TaxID=86838 RepID=A0AAV5GMY3_9BASI|nr:hypothetical protein Rhopal_007005-T1 [Rhodotorula paludigena]
MSSLFGNRTALSADDARAKAAQIKQEVEQQLALAPNDEACLMRCTDRFLEAFNLISAKYVQRVQRERESSSGAALLQ